MARFVCYIRRPRGNAAGDTARIGGELGAGSTAALEAALQMPTVKAWLDTIAWAEGGKSYQTLYGGGTFSGNQHPRTFVRAGGYNSDAAGRYQFLYKTWKPIMDTYGLPDFGPHSQDLAAIELTRQRGALEYIKAGNLLAALKTLGCAWAALPYATCRQKMRTWADTERYYNAALAVYGGSSSAAPSGGTAPGITADKGIGIAVALGVGALLLFFG